MIKKMLMIAIPVVLGSLCLFFSLDAWLRFRNEYVEVPVAAHRLFQRTRITEEDLTKVRIHKSVLNDDLYPDEEEIIGKYVKLSFSIPKGSFIWKGALESDIGDLSVSLLREGEVNYDLYVSEVKINTGGLDVGMNVDIYLSVKGNEGNVSDLLLSGCRITGLFDPQGREVMPYEGDRRVWLVSVAVMKEQVPLLNEALMAGTLSVLSGSDSYDPDARSILNEDSRVLIYLE